MSALTAILAYGLALGAVGLAAALRERGQRRKQLASDQQLLTALNKSVHGRLKTDSGEELEVYLQRAGQ
ncbi:MAG: hypothetical protein ACRD3L_12585 [Terriglobales bacterium]